MKSEKYINYTTEDFVLDDEFMQWVFHPSQENNEFWLNFLQKHPQKREQIEDAINLINSLQVVEPTVSRQNLDQIFKNIRLSKRPVRKLSRQLTKIAAVFLVLATLGAATYFYLQSFSKPLPFEIASIEQLENGKLILPDGTVNEFESKKSQIRQTGNGEFTLNNDTIKLENTSEKTKTELTQIIIPYGKRSEITLTDGTKIWLNSGSQLSYPVSFPNNSREVYLSGEAFFDVATDPKKPFKVITKDMNISVTGTRFNITSYLNDPTSQTVLLSGKVSAEKNKRFASRINLEPGERIVYNKLDDNLTKDKVNVELYSSWIDGYLIFNDEPLSNILRKLERYYNKTILTEKLSDQIKFTGKLDLVDNLGKVLENIAFSASFSVESKNDEFIIKP